MDGVENPQMIKIVEATFIQRMTSSRVINCEFLFLEFRYVVLSRGMQHNVLDVT